MVRIDHNLVAEAIGLPPEAAIALFRAKGYEITWDWREQAAAAEKQAFTVAKAMRMDILQDIKGMVQKGLDDGITFQEFRKRLEPALQAKGWWGKKVVEGPGGMQTVQLGSPHRLETIYRTNMQSAYMAGRRLEQEENAEERPYLQYIAIADSRTRPEHMAMNGKIYPINDPIWARWTPPNGYNCFPPETLVATPRGWRPIASILPGDLVIGGSGHPKAVIESFSRPFEGEISRVILNDGGFSATKNHRVLTLRGWVSAGRLKAGDVLVQIPECAQLDALIGDVHETQEGPGDSLVAGPGDHSVAVHALDAEPDFRDKNINPVPGNSSVENGTKPHFLKVANHFSLALRRLGVEVQVFFGLAGKTPPLAGGHLFADFRAPGGGCDPEPLGRFSNGLRSLLGAAKARAAAFLIHAGHRLAHLLAGHQSPVGGPDPLRPDSLTAVPNRNRVDSQEIHNGMVPHAPAGAEVPDGQHFLDIEGDQGFGDGAPLDRFDSLDSFRMYAERHGVLRVVRDVQNITYTGTVHNLEIIDDNTFCIPQVVAHNCRCRTRALTPEQADKRGGVSPAPKVEPDPGFDTNAAHKAWKPDTRTYSPEIRAVGKELVQK